MEIVELELTQPADHLCDCTFNFHWQGGKIDPHSVIPHQAVSTYTYNDLVDALKKGGNIRIKGDVGNRLAYSAGADLAHVGGTGRPEPAGRIFVNGNVGIEAGMGMVAGTLYVSGIIEEPVGNIIEVASDVNGYRKYCSITDVMCGGSTDQLSGANSMDRESATLTIRDNVLRGTIGARMDCRGTVIVEGDAFNGTGLLMRRGTVRIKGNAGMNTGTRLCGGTVVVDGTADNFAGAYMKSGSLIINNAAGYAGAGMTGGAIYSRKKIRVSPPAAEGKKNAENSTMLRRILGIGRLEAMLYNKYEVGQIKEEYVKVNMRDGSVVMRKV